MGDNTKETEEFYDLFKYINVLIIFHFVLILVVPLDIACLLLDARPECFLIGWIWDFYECLGMCLDKGMKGTLISSLLVVWTFITVVIVFYMERRESRYCGTKIWDIVAWRLKRYQKNLIVILFFTGLLLILLETVLDFFITLFLSIFLYTVTAGWALWFVVQATTDWIIRTDFKAIIRWEYEKEKENTDHPYMQSFLDILAECREKELDLLIELMTDDIMGPFIESEDRDIVSMQKMLYELMDNILKKSEGNPLKRQFAKALARKLEEKTTEKSELFLPLSYAVAFPMLEKIDDTWEYLYIDFAASLSPDSSGDRKKLLLGGVIYTFYLETQTREYSHQYVRDEILQYLEPELTKEDRRYVLEFLRQLRQIVSIGQKDNEDTWQEHIWDKVRKVFKFE